MAMNRWDPFRDLISIQDQINQLFDTSLSRREGKREPQEGSWAPAVDVREDEQAITLVIDLPGVNEKEVEITVSGEQLVIKGERPAPETEGRYLRRERTSGPFYRSFVLTSPVAEEKIKAKYRNGVLEVSLPRKEEAKPKKVTIETP